MSMKCVVLCFASRISHFTRRKFFFDSGIAMLTESAAICDSITSSAVIEPWSLLETTSRPKVVAEVCVCVNQAVDRRMAVKDSQEQWNAVGGIRPSAERSASRYGVRISNIVEEGRVEDVPLSVLSISFPGPSSQRDSSGNLKKRKIRQSPVKRRFETTSTPSLSQQHRVDEVLGFSAALDRQQTCRNTGRSWRNRRAAPVFLGGLP